MTEPLRSSDLPLSGLPGAIIIGAAKSGTSSLARLLGRHPRVFISTPKELNFFSRDEEFAKGLDWYRTYFAAANSNQLLIEASTEYTRNPQMPLAPERLHDTLPGAKLIYLMRHPVKRAYSHYVHRWVKELHPGEPSRKSFEEHVVDDPMCLDSSNYQLQLEPYFRLFGEDRVLLLFLEELEEDQAGTLLRVLTFLGLDDGGIDWRVRWMENSTVGYREVQVRASITDRLKQNRVVAPLLRLTPGAVRRWAYRRIVRPLLGKKIAAQFTPPPMRPETHAQLLERFRPSNAWVKRQTGRDLSAWSR
jgi:hypothetical protein